MNYYYNDEIFLSLSSNVYKMFLEYKNSYNFKIESGGIVVGSFNPTEQKIVVTDVTEPQSKDRCSAFAYKRAEFGHQEIMDKLWEDSKHTKTYVGEWHTHNEHIPQPSSRDKENWLEISRRKHNLNWLFFIIVGTEQMGVWTIINNRIVKMNEFATQ